MPDASDMDLLRDYAHRNFEPAFAELVRRHLALVYSVALRFTRNPPDAEDVAQAVFVILARKAASLRTGTILTGWLYETTRLTALHWLRTQTRRRHHEQEAHMQSTLDNSNADAVWRQVEPLLELAMSRLNEKDRTLLALRFYENRSGAETAAILGIGEWAAHKRAARALEKLRSYFSTRGVDSTASAIAESILVNSIQAAPAALAKTITAIALAKGAAASTSTLTLIKGALKVMAWTKAKTAAVAGAAVILATGTGVVVVKEIHHKPGPVHLAAGALPQTLEELNAWYVEPPAGQNAATFNLEGFNAMQTQGADRNANLPILGKLPPPSPFTPLATPVKSALTDFVQRNRQALQLFAEGAQHQQSRYPIDFTQGQQMQMPHLQKIKSGMQVSEMAAILDAENNDGKQAAADVMTTFALARSLNAEPMLISQLVRAAGVSLAVDALNQVVNRTTVPTESLSELSDAFKKMEDYDAQGKGFNRSLIGEKVMVLAAFKKASVQELAAFAAQDATEEQRQRMVQLLKQPGGLKDEQDYLETTFDQFLAARKEPFPKRLKNAAVVQRHATETTNGELLLNNSWLTGYPGIVSREARCLANLRLALTALALEQYRAAHGNQYPARLSDLTPNYLNAIPMDPFDGQPLRYRQQGKGYVLYSIGPDLKDNGGERMTANGGDLVFAVASPP